MNTDIKKALLSINFGNRYKRIIEEFPDNDDKLDNYSLVIASNIIEKLGYKYKYFKSENFFRIIDPIDNYTFWLHISLKYGLVDLMLYVKENNIILKPCGSFNWLVVDIEFTEEPFTLPCFTDYEEFREIIVELLKIYEDFKQAFLKEVQQERKL